MTWDNPVTGETLTISRPVGGVSRIELNGQVLHTVRFCDYTGTASLEDGRSFTPHQFGQYVLSLIQPKGGGRNA